MPCNSQDGETHQFGQDHALASLLVSQAEVKALTTNNTYGQNSKDLSPSAILQQSLENRLRVRLAAYGSRMYALTWSHWNMPLGPPIFVRRASALPNREHVSFGWPTPSARDYRDITKSEIGYAVQRARHQPSAVTRAYLRGMHSTQIAPLYRILMGFPVQWEQFMPTATPSSRKSRQSSSKPT